MVESRLTYLKPNPECNKKPFYTCSCGTVKSLSKYHVDKNLIVSCGCYNLEKIGKLNKQDITGQSFNSLTILGRADPIIRSNGKPRTRWLCQCKCGNTTKVTSDDLKSGKTKSCGCERFKKGKDHHNYKHGMSGKDDMIYSRWTHIRQRSFDLEDPIYKDVFLDEPWFSDFMTFHDWMIEQLAGRELTKDLEVDRWPNKLGNYGPTNCRLVDKTTNARNKTSNLIIDAFFELIPLAEAVEKYSNLMYGTVQNRIDNGWNPEKALMIDKLMQWVGQSRHEVRRPVDYNKPPTDDERHKWIEYITNHKLAKKGRLLEVDIKRRLEKIFESKYIDYDMYSELWVGTARADLAILTDGKFIGFEIKSDGDDLSRFNTTQRHCYPYFFDEMWLVVADRHIDKAKVIISNPTIQTDCKSWGLMDIDGNVLMGVKDNDYVVEDNRLSFMLNKLWKEDLITELKSKGVKGYSNKGSEQLRQLLKNNLKPEEIRPLVRRYVALHKPID